MWGFNPQDRGSNPRGGAFFILFKMHYFFNLSLQNSKISQLERIGLISQFNSEWI